MISSLLIHPDISSREEEAEKILAKLALAKNHPNILWFAAEDKLGIEQARSIKDFLSLKPYQGKHQAVVVIAAENLTDEAQNALLKTLEEPPQETVLILGVGSEDQLLPTIVSRCQVVDLTSHAYATPEARLDSARQVEQKYQQEIEKLLTSSVEERFQFVEKLEDREAFLHALTAYFRKQLLSAVHLKGGQLFLQDLIEAEKWANQNVNIRAILEYLMLKLPQDKNS
ncbi:hypothetical protein HY385_03095 [Candidatus Daviesbacteria bacterium]|nr:hypothetical protein [Candidatus Daviesbacteria bacterium]